MTARKTRPVKPERRWAIYGNCGLYVGQQMTRADMIAQHVHMIAGVSQFARGGKLSEDQREAWKQCKRRGDYCVPVLVTPAPQRRRRS